MIMRGCSWVISRLISSMLRRAGLTSSTAFCGFVSLMTGVGFSAGRPVGSLRVPLLL